MPFEEYRALMAPYKWDVSVPKPLAEVSPLDGLPPTIKNAVAEVHRRVQAPLAMVTASALGAISLVCQDAINIRRNEDLISPCSLFLLTISESGDRKSTVDRIFTKPIVDFEEKRNDEYKNQLSEYNSAIMAWDHIQKMILSSIRKHDSVGNSFEQLKTNLHEHQKIKPPAPIRQKLIYSNATPESIIYSMYINWPSAGIVSDEAGGILNGRAMSDLGMLNQLWDGSALTVDRRASESFSLKNARLTISLMTQESSVQKFIARGDNIARGIGFLARCLVAKPVSMQGNRILNFNSPKDVNQMLIEESGSKALKKFEQRLTDILNKTLENKQQLNHQKEMLELTGWANELWVDFHNEVEIALKDCGNWVSVKDAASKIADNAARLAAIFHYFEGENGPISNVSMEYAITSCRIYLSNFKNLFGAYGHFSEDRRDIDKIVNWLNSTTYNMFEGGTIPKNDLLKRGPVRNISQLNKIIAYLEKQEAMRIIEQDKFSVVQINRGHPFFAKTPVSV